MPKHELKVPTDRIETLTDGIFAIAMTLLVLSIEVPTLPAPVTPAVFSAYVNSILLQIFIYVVGFILLAVFWMNHHIFYVIERTNTTLLWINILWLMSIALVPFSTAIVGRYGQFQLAQLLFDVNMLIIGLLWYANWSYASRKGFVAEKVTPYAVQIRRSNLALPILAIIAIIVSFISPIGSFYVFVLVPVYSHFIPLRRALENAVRQLLRSEDVQEPSELLKNTRMPERPSSLFLLSACSCGCIITCRIEYRLCKRFVSRKMQKKRSRLFSAFLPPIFTPYY